MTESLAGRTGVIRTIAESVSVIGAAAGSLAAAGTLAAAGAVKGSAAGSVAIIGAVTGSLTGIVAIIGAVTGIVAVTGSLMGIVSVCTRIEQAHSSPCERSPDNALPQHRDVVFYSLDGAHGEVLMLGTVLPVMVSGEKQDTINMINYTNSKVWGHLEITPMAHCLLAF